MIQTLLVLSLRKELHSEYLSQKAWDDFFSLKSETNISDVTTSKKQSAKANFHFVRPFFFYERFAGSAGLAENGAVPDEEASASWGLVIGSWWRYAPTQSFRILLHSATKRHILGDPLPAKLITKSRASRTRLKNTLPVPRRTGSRSLDLVTFTRTLEGGQYIPLWSRLYVVFRRRKIERVILSGISETWGDLAISLLKKKVRILLVEDACSLYDEEERTNKSLANLMHDPSG